MISSGDIAPSFSQVAPFGSFTRTPPCTGFPRDMVAPSAGLSVKLLYYQKIPSLATTDPNWLLTAHPDIYLFGALLHGGVYGKDDPQLARVSAGYGAAVNGLRSVTHRVRFAGGSLQSVAA